MNPFYFVILIASHVLSGLAQEWQSLSLLEGNSLSLSCPNRISLWLLDQFPENASIIIKYDRTNQQYDCIDTDRSHSDTKRVFCANGLNVARLTGSPLILYPIMLTNAGIYGCHYTPPLKDVQVKMWDVTVVSKSRAAFTFNIDGESFNSSLSVRRAVHEGSIIAVTCVSTYAGSHDPGLEIALIDTYSVRKVLATSIPSTSDSTFSSSSVAHVSAQYIVKSTDCSFYISCGIGDLEKSNIASQLFQQSWTMCNLVNSSSSFHVVLPAIITLIFVILVLTTAIIVVIMRKRKSRQLVSRRAVHDPQPDDCSTDDQPPPYLDAIRLFVEVPPEAPPSYSEFQQAEASTAASPQAAFHRSLARPLGHRI